MSTARDRPISALVSEDAAKGGGNAHRTANVGAELERRKTHGDRRCAAARGAAWRALDIIRIVGSSIDRIVRLPVGEHGRHVGFAHDNGAGSLEPLHRNGVLAGLVGAMIS